MARYQVPQYIEVEDKIFGPLTFKQFIYLIGSGGFAFVAFRIFPGFIAILVAAPVIGLATALAFYKINNKPFVFTLEAAFRYFTKNRLYIWKKEAGKIKRKTKKIEGNKVQIPKLSSSRLGELTWGLDINETVEN